MAHTSTTAKKLKAILLRSEFGEEILFDDEYYKVFTCGKRTRKE
jgi:hypothetical protein